MFERELKLYAYNLWYGKQLVADVPDEQMAEQPVEGANHPAWVLGHLVIAADYGLDIIGVKQQAPSEWHDIFDPGTVPSPERSLYPTKDELVAGYQTAHQQLTLAVTALEHPERLSNPNPFESLRHVMPTVAELLAHILTTHEATHLGQLSAWRRQLGLKPVGG